MTANALKHAVEPRQRLQEILRAGAIGDGDRAEQALAMRYHDGHQVTESLRLHLEEMDTGLAPGSHMTNQLNSVLGNEHTTRTDPKVDADDESGVEVAEAINEKLHEAWRLNDLHACMSRCYKPQMIKGLGWCYVGKNTDPLGYEFDVHDVHSDEIAWDRRSTHGDLHDCRWLTRKRYMEVDEALSMFPENEALIRQTFSEYNDGNFEIFEGGEHVHDGYHAGCDESEYRNQLFLDDHTQKIAVYDLYYRSYDEHPVIRWEDGRAELYDPMNVQHSSDYMNGKARVVRKRIGIMRNAWFIGPYLISDEVSPHPHNEYPYVQFPGYREDETGYLYGLGRTMMQSQDKYNHADVQMHLLMDRVTVIMDDDATEDTDETVVREAHKAQGLIRKRPGREIIIKHHFDQIAQFSNAKQEAIEEMRAVSGISLSFTGEQENQKSGVAIRNLAQMSANTLAEINAEYSEAKTRVARLLMYHIAFDIGSKPMEVPLKSDSGKVKRVVQLNRPGEDGIVSNHVPMVRMQVTLSDVATSAGHRQQNAEILQSTMQNAPEQMLAPLYVAWLKTANIPQAAELLDQFQRMTGIADSDEEQQQMDEQKAQQAQEAADMEKRRLEAEIALTQAKAAEAQARAVAALGGAQTAAVQPELDAKAANDQSHLQKVKMMSEIRAAQAQRLQA